MEQRGGQNNRPDNDSTRRFRPRTDSVKVKN
jgi:hypothetical protein